MFVFTVRRCVARVLLIFIVAVPVMGLAAPQLPTHDYGNPQDTLTLTLAQATQRALARNPQLAVSGYVLKASEARIAQAGLKLNPELSVELEDFLGTASLRGVKSLQTTLALSQVIELGNKRQLRIGSASAARDVEIINQQAAQLDVLAEVTRRFIDVVALQEALQLAERTVALRLASVEAIEVRVRAARSPQAERSRADIALTRAQLDQQHIASRLQAARRTLAATWGDTQVVYAQANADLFNLPELVSFEQLLQRLQDNPDFTGFAAQARLRDAELRLAQAQARANLSLSLGVRRIEASNDTALVAGFSIPLRMHDRNQGNIRELELRRAQTTAEEQAARIQAQATLFALYQQLSHSRTRCLALRSSTIPQAKQALDQVQYGYERGRFSYLELLAAQSELLELESAAIDAAADSQRMLAEIERLTSEALVSTP